MAQDGDVEHGTVSPPADEETPLLTDQAPDEQPHQKELEKRKASWYIWRLFWILVAALILGVFIKGWVDAGADVDVRPKIMMR